jgi:hypothetical protein
VFDYRYPHHYQMRGHNTVAPPGASKETGLNIKFKGGIK